jgi:hypothetical protein
MGNPLPSRAYNFKQIYFTDKRCLFLKDEDGESVLPAALPFRLVDHYPQSSLACSKLQRSSPSIRQASPIAGLFCGACTGVLEYLVMHAFLFTRGMIVKKGRDRRTYRLSTSFPSQSPVVRSQTLTN